MAELHQESVVQAGIVLADPEDGTKDLGMQARGEKMDTPHLSGTAPPGVSLLVDFAALIEIPTIPKGDVTVGAMED